MGAPSFGALHPSGHAEGARQQLPYTVSPTNSDGGAGPGSTLKVQQPRPCPPGAPSRMGKDKVNREDGMMEGTQLSIMTTGQSPEEGHWVGFLGVDTGGTFLRRGGI